MTLAPGAIGTFHFSVATADDETPYSPGVSITFGDAQGNQSGIIHVILAMDAVKTLTVDRAVIVLGTIRPTGSTMPAFTVHRGRMALPFTTIAADVSTPALVADVHQLDPDTWSVSIRQVAALTYGALDAGITVRPVVPAMLGDAGKVATACVGIVRGDWTVSPAAMFSGSMNVGVSQSAEFLVCGSFTTGEAQLPAITITTVDPDLAVLPSISRMNDRKWSMTLAMTPKVARNYHDIITCRLASGGSHVDLNVDVRGQAH